MRNLDNPAIIELMFPETQTAPAPTGAADPSFADIVREQTNGGRTIIRFFADAMTGDLPNFKACHRVDASAQLIKLQASPFAHIVLEYTDGGRLITQFLHEAMTGQLPGFEDCHQMAAGRLLAKVDPDMAQALTEDNTPRRSREEPAPYPIRGGNPSRLHTGAVGAPSHDLHTTGAPLHTGAVGAIVRQETNDGRDIVRFYADVMRGVLTGFKTHERMDAADKLVSLSYDHTPCVPAPCRHANANANDDTGVHTGAVGVGTVSPSNPWGTPRKPEWRHFEYPEDNSYDFSIYGEEEYRRDRYGDKALVHIFGDDETKSVSNHAVLDYKVDLIEAQRAAVHSEYETCQPYDPCPSCRVPDPPDDDSFGRDTYGYNALLYIYGDKSAARVGYTAAMDHREKIRLGILAAEAHDIVDPDHPGNGPDPPDPPKPRTLAYF